MAAMKRNGPTGFQWSNSRPPTCAIIRMPSAPNRLKRPITATREWSGASFPINVTAEMFAAISPAATSAAAMNICGPNGSSRNPSEPYPISE